MLSLIICSILSSALFYLGSRAKITEMLWSAYPPTLARFMDCSACVGFWWGMLLALSGQFDMSGVPFVALEERPLQHCITVGLCMLVLTPIVAGSMQRGFDSVGQAVPAESDDDDG